jgi:hypothetical protein
MEGNSSLIENLPLNLPILGSREALIHAMSMGYICSQSLNDTVRDTVLDA